MSEGMNLCKAFEQYYSTERSLSYTDRVRASILDRFDNVPYRYAEALFDEVTRSFSGRGRNLPELADVERAASKMDRPEVYAEPKQKALPPPESSGGTRESWAMFLRKVGSAMKVDPDKLLAEQDEELNHAERERVRVRAMKGNATVYERHWLWCIEKNGGKHVNIMQGPFADEAVREEIHRHIRASKSAQEV